MRSLRVLFRTFHAHAHTASRRILYCCVSSAEETRFLRSSIVDPNYYASVRNLSLRSTQFIVRNDRAVLLFVYRAFTRGSDIVVRFFMFSYALRFP